MVQATDILEDSEDLTAAAHYIYSSCVGENQGHGELARKILSPF